MKRCAECGTVANDEAPYCSACGGSTWQSIPAHSIHLWQSLLGALVALFLAGLAWYLWNGK